MTVGIYAHSSEKVQPGRCNNAKRGFLLVVATAAWLATSFLYPSYIYPSKVKGAFHEPDYFTSLTNDTDPRDVYPVHLLPPSDRHVLINMTDFYFSVRPAPSRDCLSSSSYSSSSSRPLILVLIHSAPENHERRAVIRNTWLSRRPDHVVALFMIGIVARSVRLTQLVLQHEKELYGDLVQGNFVDSYRNMTYKHVMTLKYAVYHCPGARYVVKTDDDIMVNLDYLRDIFETMSPYGVRDLLLCAMRANLKVERSYRSKWRVSYGEYPLRKYPKYCSGGAVIYSPDVVFRIYKAVQQLPFFWIDDVHVTGTAAIMAGVRHMHFASKKNPFWIFIK